MTLFKQRQIRDDFFSFSKSEEVILPAKFEFNLNKPEHSERL